MNQPAFNRIHAYGSWWYADLFHQWQFAALVVIGLGVCLLLAAVVAAWREGLTFRVFVMTVLGNAAVLLGIAIIAYVIALGHL